jgi:bacteriorhodopsin
MPLLGGLAARRGSATSWTWLGIACFGGVALLALVVHRPRSQSTSRACRDCSYLFAAWAAFGIDVLWCAVEFLRGA